MPSDYKGMTEHNERQLGLDTASRKTQICMYSDSTHFVYEILQNADDYGATEIFFKLSEDQLLIEHNGEPFKEENVKAITYFGKSTSCDDLVKTGRFGVGFKSVFAFTATPIIISGKEHFQIYGLYRVREYPYPDDYSLLRTRIILPFNHNIEKPDYVENLISPEEAFAKISSRLTSLNMNTLLFTKSIREIRWEITGNHGRYLREDKGGDGFRRTTTTNGESIKKYLVFSRTPTWQNRQYKPVEIAFEVDEKGVQICAADECLYVLFATTQETHLLFILNGPYRTNPSRETISEEDHFNVHLMNETCSLIKDVLPQIRDMGLLTTQFLSVLPNATDKLRNFYQPILKSIINAFNSNALVPTDDNQYAAAVNVLQGPAVLREVVAREELSFLTARSNVCWAKGVQQNSRADNFLRGLNTQPWGWSQLEDALVDKFDNDVSDDNSIWLSKRTDVWLQRLYIILADAIKKEECSEWSLNRCHIIRVIEGGKENHLSGPKAYFPKGKGRSYKGLPQIKRAILCSRSQATRQKIQKSLEILGVAEIGDEERIDILLDIYAEDDPRVTKEQHLQHMRAFLKWWKKEAYCGKFAGCAIFRSVRNENPYELAQNCFLDSPLRKSGLQVIYGSKKLDIPKKFKVWAGYSKLKSEGFCDFAVSCGVVDGLRIRHREFDRHPLYEQEGGWLSRRAKINNDYYIPHLTQLLAQRNREINLLIWDTVCIADPCEFRAEYQRRAREEKRIYKSSFILELTESGWIPNKKGRLRKPQEITKEELHGDFKYDNRNGWLDEIGFGENAKRLSADYQARNVSAKRIGFESVEEAEKMAQLAHLCRQQGRSPDDLFLQLTPVRDKKQPPFPETTTANPERRSERLAEQLAGAPEKQYGERERRVRTTRGAVDASLWLRNQYTNNAGQMVCQICKEEMPFRKRDGEYYFEAVEAFSKDYFSREHEGQFLALCPVCAARYREFVKLDESVMKDLNHALKNADKPELALNLGELITSIRFVESHFTDIKTILGNQE